MRFGLVILIAAEALSRNTFERYATVLSSSMRLYYVAGSCEDHFHPGFQTLTVSGRQFQICKGGRILSRQGDGFILSKDVSDKVGALVSMRPSVLAYSSTIHERVRALVPFCGLGLDRIKAVIDDWTVILFPPAMSGFSQNGEDIISFTLLSAFGADLSPPKGKTVGYLEMGALDGLYLSTTNFYRSKLNWTGILLEPGYKYKSLVKNRPHDITLQKLVCDVEREYTYVEAGEIGGILEFLAPENIRNWNIDTTKTRRMKCQTLESIFEELGVTHTRVFSLDVEGAEAMVLRSIDWSKRTFDIIHVEQSPHETNKSGQIAAQRIIETAGYVYLGTVVYSGFFVHKDLFERMPLGARIQCCGSCEYTQLQTGPQPYSLGSVERKNTRAGVKRGNKRRRA